MLLKNKIRKFTVRIEKICDENEKNDILGSGVLWRPANTTSLYDYVFTAAHVVDKLVTNNEKDRCIVRYLDDNDNEQYTSIEEIALHLGYQKLDNGALNNDIAVIKCSKTNTTINSYYLVEPMGNEDNDRVLFRGYPNCTYTDESFKLSAQSAGGIIKETAYELGKFKYQIDPIELPLKDFDTNNELVGFSGMGIFVDKTQEILLTGIHSYGVGEEVPYNMVVAMCPRLIIEICVEKNWDIPQYGSEIKGNLGDCISFFEDEVENVNLTNIFYDELIGMDFKRIICCSSCGYTKECVKDIPKYRCSCFRGNLLILLCILRYVNGEIPESELYVRLGNERYPIMFICSEGTGVSARIQMKHFINSLKTDYLWKNKVKENSLIIWASQNAVTGELEFSKTKFEKILPDIRRNIAQAGVKNGVDIKQGIIIPPTISIVHIDEIKDFIKEISEESDLEEITSKFRKLLQVEV